MNKIFWAGDSTVQTNDITTFPQHGIGQAFPSYIKEGYVVCNHAKNGRSTKSFMEEGRLEAIDEQIGEGDFLFIQFGHNDEKAQDPERYTVPGGSFNENLRTFIGVARRHGARPVLITSLERRWFGEDGRLGPSQHVPYVQAVKQVAAEENVALVDLYAMSREEMNKVGAERTEEWFMNLKPGVYRSCPEGKTDNTHLQYTGALVFAGLVAKGLKECGGIYADIVLDEALDDFEKAGGMYKLLF